MERITIILLAFVVQVVLLTACSNPKTSPVAQAKNDVHYTCPMHPQILEDNPGRCPICGMTLVKRSGQAGESASISLKTVLQPVNSNVISSINSITPKLQQVPLTIAAEGYLDFDTRTFNNIASRFSGRIEKLYIKYAFQEIYAGERIFDIYSPDMVTAQQDLLYLTRNSPNEISLINAARQKLLLIGMTASQISQVVKSGKAFYSLPVYSPYDGHVHDVAHSQMTDASDAKPSVDVTNNLPLNIKEGMYVQKGQTLFNVVNPHKLWAVMKIDAASTGALKLNQPVRISFPDIPGKTINGRVNFIEPTLKNGDKTVSIRVYLDNMDHGLKVNSLVTAKIESKTINGLWIPRAALLDLGGKKVVWLKKGAVFQAHEVFAGDISGNQIQIIKALSVTDSLASNAQYLTDSESFIKVQGND